MTCDIEGYTVPALLVSRGTDPSVVEANEAFCCRVDESPRGESLAAVADRCLESTDGSAFPQTAARETATTAVEFPSGDEEYVPQIARETEGGRHLLFVQTPNRMRTRSETVAHVVSHDLRNPLDVAKAHLRASRDDRDDDHLETVARAHDRMEEIIRDVMALARGKSALSPAEGVDTDAVVSDAWDGVAAPDAELAVDDTLPVTTADRPRLERLVENLLRNAVDHAGHAPRIRVGPLSDESGIYVADDGTGVPPDRREAVFEPGYTESDGGTGLGLAIVVRIADAHGWDVRIDESRYGGARVEVAFDGGQR